MLVPTIVQLIADRFANQQPILRLGLRHVLRLETYAAAQLVPSCSGFFDACVLTTIAVTTVKFVKTVMTIALRIRPAKHGTYTRGGRLTPRPDAMRAFRIVAQDDVNPLEGRGAAGFAAENDMQAIYGAPDEFEAFGLRGVMPMQMGLADENLAKRAIDGEGVGGGVRRHSDTPE